MRRTLLTSISVLIVLFIGSCNDKPTQPIDGIPENIRLMNPPDQAADQSLVVELNWTTADNFDDSLSVDLFVGDNTPPKLFIAGLTADRWHSDVLLAETRYYWRVVLRKGDSVITTSPIRTFTTAKLHVPIPEYPLAIGNNWTYQGLDFIRNIRPDSLQAEFSDTVSFVASVAIVGADTTTVDSVLRNVLLFEELTVRGAQGMCIDTNMYGVSGDSMHQFSRTGSAPQKFCGANISLRGSSGLSQMLTPAGVFSGPSQFYAAPRVEASDNGQVSSDLVAKVFQFPLEVGGEWSAWPNPSQNSQWGIRKTVVGYEILETPAGEFDCAKVLWSWDFNNDGEYENDLQMIDYISEIGLVKREYVGWDIPLTTYQNPYGAGVGDVVTEFTLTSFSVQN